MADKARGMVSMTPTVTVTADADSDAVDVIHHDIKKTLGGKLEYEKEDETIKWYYSEAHDVTSNADLLTASNSFTDGSGSIATDDHVKFIFVKNTGKTDTGETTSATLCLTTNGTNPASGSNALAMGPGESIILKFRTRQDVTSLHGASTSGTIRAIVAALIEDESA